MSGSDWLDVQRELSSLTWKENDVALPITVGFLQGSDEFYELCRRFCTVWLTTSFFWSYQPPMHPPYPS